MNQIDYQSYLAEIKNSINLLSKDDLHQLSQAAIYGLAHCFDTIDALSMESMREKKWTLLYCALINGVKHDPAALKAFIQTFKALVAKRVKGMLEFEKCLKHFEESLSTIENLYINR